MIYRQGKLRSFTPKLYTTTAPAKPIPLDRIKWSWTGRAFDPRQEYWLVQQRDGEPRPGDLVLAQVKAVGLVDTIVTVEGVRVQLYVGDGLIGVLGNPTALAMYEAEVAEVEPLHLVNKGGMVGTVRPDYCALLQPTQLTFLGYLADAQGQCLNLGKILLQSKTPARLPMEGKRLVLEIS